jgi:hypothetical protein
MTRKGPSVDLRGGGVRMANLNSVTGLYCDGYRNSAGFRLFVNSISTS